MKAEILQRLRQQVAGATAAAASTPSAVEMSSLDATDSDLFRQYLFDDVESRSVFILRDRGVI